MTFSFGDIVRVAETPETVERGIANGVGMVVGVKVTSSADPVVGGGELASAILVSLEAPVEESFLIAEGLLHATGETTEWEIVDGLAGAREDYEDTVAAALVRVRSTPETD